MPISKEARKRVWESEDETWKEIQGLCLLSLSLSLSLSLYLSLSLSLLITCGFSLIS